MTHFDKEGKLSANADLICSMIKIRMAQEVTNSNLESIKINEITKSKDKVQKDSLREYKI